MRGHELLLVVVGMLSFEKLLVHHVKLLDGYELIVLQVRRIDVIHLEVNIDVLVLMLLIFYDLGPGDNQIDIAEVAAIRVLIIVGTSTATILIRIIVIIMSSNDVLVLLESKIVFEVRLAISSRHNRFTLLPRELFCVLWHIELLSLFI